MADKKVIFLDVDGTTVRDDKTISEENKNAIQRAMADGHAVVIATGRAISSGLAQIEKFGMNCEGGYLISYNGAAAYDCGKQKLLYDMRLPLDVVKTLHEKAKEKGIFIQSYKGQVVIADKLTEELEYYCKNTGMSYEVGEELWDNLTEGPSKVLLCNLYNQEKLEEFRRERADFEEGTCSSMFTCKEYLEYCPVGATKGEAALRMCEYLGIPVENSIAVGDQENDLSMIQTAHVGVAMQNAAEIVKKNAQYITERDNNHNGVAEVFEKFVF